MVEGDIDDGHGEHLVRVSGLPRNLCSSVLELHHQRNRLRGRDELMYLDRTPPNWWLSGLVIGLVVLWFSRASLRRLLGRLRRK